MAYKDLPDLTFAESDPETVELQIIGIVEKLLGRTLARADPLRLFLKGVEALLVQQRLLIDETAKQGLLAYATGKNLDHLGILVGTERLAAAAAKTTIKLTLSAARETATIIPAGTRFTAGDGVMFALDNDIIIGARQLTAEAIATCTQKGTIGNGYKAGELANIADPVAFLASAANTTATGGGTDIEEDDAYRDRIYQAPEKFSCAGTPGAYEYFAKEASSLISDVIAYNPEPGVTRVCLLLQNGEIPDAEILRLVEEKLTEKTIKALTDKIEVEAPKQVNASLTVSYWIGRNDAVYAYIIWQKEKLGRDINPTELFYRLRAAGVKRADLGGFVAQVIEANQVAVINHVEVKFEGLEDA